MPQYWVKVGNKPATKITCEIDDDIDDFKLNIKTNYNSTFEDFGDIIVRDRNNNEIDPGKIVSSLGIGESALNCFQVDVPTPLDLQENNKRLKMFVNNDISICWKAIVNGSYSKNGRLWTLNNNAKWIGDIGVFYNREIYDEFINLLKLYEYPQLTTKTLCLIYGTPGIGKTLFLLAVLVAIVENARRSKIALPIVHYVKRMKKGDSPVTWSLLPDGEIEEWQVTANNPDYLLSDGCNLMKANGRILNIEIASDKENNYNAFLKRISEADGISVIGIKKIMPLFSFDELLAIKASSISDECAQFLWLVFGGSARKFKDSVSYDNYICHDVDVAMDWFFKDTTFKLDFPDVWKKVLMMISEELIKNGDASNTMDVINSMMYHRLPDTQKIWASKFMCYLAGVILNNQEINLWKTLEYMLGNQVVGVVFESISHKLLTISTNQKLLQIFKKDSRNQNVKYDLTKNFNLPISFIRSVDDIKSLKNEHYGLPIFDNFPLVDAVIQPNILVQYTVSPVLHKGAAEKLTAIRNNLSERNPSKHMMIFVIPISNIKSFQYQVALDIKQYVTTVTNITALMNKNQLNKFNSKNRQR